MEENHTQREKKARIEQDICEHIMGIHFMHPEFGWPRITDELNENGYLINHKKIYRLMTEMDIQSVIRKKRNDTVSPSVISLNRL